MPAKWIIDTDPGIDDALAIFMALASPELEIVALTTVFGNVDVDLATANALRLLEIAGRSDIPVAAGAAAPLAGTWRGAIPHIHGDDGQGNTDLPPPRSEPTGKTAAELLIEASRDPGELSLLTLGPLTNLALALEQDPGLVDRLREVVVMGGNALVPGNATPAAEANVWNDAEAADLVFGRVENLVMVGLDVTHEVAWDGARIVELGRSRTATARHLADELAFYHAFFVDNHGFDGVYLHDPTAVAYLLDPALFTTRRWPLRVETEGLSRGKTWPASGPTDRVPEPWRGRPRTAVCTEVEAGRVADLVYDRLVG